MDFSSFLTSLVTSFLIFVILMLLFAYLSRKPGNAVIYYPNRILRGLDPADGAGSSTRNPFAWIREAMSSTELDVINMSGVDTAVYFVFLSTVLGILVLSGIILLPVLIPVAMTDHGANSKSNSQTTSNGTFSELDKLSMGNITEKSPRLWAFLIATYWVSFVTYYLLWKAYKHVATLRGNALKSPEVRSEQFAALVRDVPNAPTGDTRKEQVDSYFKTIYPETFYRSLIVTENKKVNKMWEELVGYRKKLARAEAIYAESKKQGSGEGLRPTSKTGFLGLFGKKVDSIEYYNELINALIPKLDAEQKVTAREKQQCSAIVFFTSRTAAASAGQSLHAQMVDTWTVTNAPEPCQVIWDNLKITYFQRQIRQYVVYVIVFFTIVFYMIPIAFISAFTTLANLQKLLPFLKPVLSIAVVKTALEAYLPQIALIIFLALLPKFLLFLSKAEGIPTLSHAIRAASGKYFYFSVVNVFIGVTIGGTIFNTIKTIENDPNSIIDLLAQSLPDNATFFITYVALKFFVGYGLELSRLIPLIIFHLKKKYLCKTEAEIKEAWRPGDLGYGTRIPGDLLVVTIVLCYSVIAPIIIPFGVLYFGLGWLVLRNQALKVCLPAYESYGRMWPHIHTRLLAALILYQVTMLGYFGTKKFYFAPFLIPLVILSFIFTFICSKKFYPAFAHTPLEVTSQELKESPNMDRIFSAYIPPSLCSDKQGNDQQENAQHEDAFSQAVRSVLTNV